MSWEEAKTKAHDESPFDNEQQYRIQKEFFPLWLVH